jgi:carboxyl-terminal processing protease
VRNKRLSRLPHPARFSQGGNDAARSAGFDFCRSRLLLLFRQQHFRDKYIPHVHPSSPDSKWTSLSPLFSRIIAKFMSQLSRAQLQVFTVIARRIPLVLLLLSFVPARGQNPKVIKEDRRRTEEILNQVSKDVHDNFYDPALKGLDWPTLTEQARQRIRNADEAGQMFGAISGLLYQLHDSHTAFIPPQRSVRAEYGFEAKPFGDQILVYQLAKDGPAAKAGLKLGDQIAAVNNLNAVRPTFFEMMRYLTILDPREELNVEVEQDGSTRIFKIPATITPISRELLVTDRESFTKHHTFTVNDHEDGVVYVHLPSFAILPVEIERMAKRVKGAKAVVLDLRGNGGGLLETMTELVGKFVQEPYVMATEDSRKKQEPIRIKPGSPQITCPLVVLIDSASASASEMVASTLQTHKRALVIGDKSSGRVEKAQFFWRFISYGDRLPFGTEIATSRVVMEEGRELENRGVTPDELCVPTPADLRSEKDPCLDRALALASVANHAQPAPATGAK